MFLTILKNHPNSALIRSWKKKPSGKERLRLLPTSVAPMFCLGFSLSFLFFLDSFFLFVFFKRKGTRTKCLKISFFRNESNCLSQIRKPVYRYEAERFSCAADPKAHRRKLPSRHPHHPFDDHNLSHQGHRELHGHELCGVFNLRVSDWARLVPFLIWPRRIYFANRHFDWQHPF